MSMSTDDQVVRHARCLAHPLRIEILECIGVGEASPKEIADTLAKPLSVVSYHVKLLKQFGCVRLVRTAPRRGATEHFYRASDSGLIERARGALGSVVPAEDRS